MRNDWEKDTKDAKNISEETDEKGLTRRDIIYVNDVQKLDVSNTFPGACGGSINEFCDDPATGGPYIMWPGTPYAHLMVPVADTHE